MQACDRCRRRKSGCDKVQPSCGVCDKAGVACVYTDRTKKPAIRRDVIERLERRLRQTEATNRALTARLAAFNSTSNNENTPSTTKSPPTEESRNEVSDEVSFLSLNAGGERQFLGSTSGVLFADLIKSAIEADASSNTQLSAQGSGPTLASARAAQVLTSIREGPPSLPESVARDLHHAYFEHDHLCFPILCQQSAMANLKKTYVEPSTFDRKPYETFSFYMILAISASNVQKLHWQSLPEAETYHTQAMSRLNDILALGGLEALQAILLLCQYQLTNSSQRTSTSLWHMVGMAARMCFEMGLHREEAYNYRGNANTSPFTSPIHRRWLWCVVAMDRVVSITLGRPFAIHLEDVDLALPTYDTPEEHETNPMEEQYRETVFAHIIRYRILCGRIMSTLHRSRYTNNEQSALTAQAESFLMTWKSGIPRRAH